MALFRSSYRIAADVLLDSTEAAGDDRLSLPSLATFLLRGYVDGTIAVKRTAQEVGAGHPRTGKDLALDRDLLTQADAKRASEEVAQSLAHLLEILFRAYARGQISLSASGRAGGRESAPPSGS
ncbi:hypothetical protein [Streptomyces yaizuensis]|uniref:Uncharacterized protein n=1 Tax=Streptomyces yaizuensis TaxID=2989713 RepID=A0ABQ5P646_9ACTN|nr:hypothetical protein [Streptomyces sp. YSPA8]GLF98059.1 hypothetical protein SYYSPA8_27200 [Streptomyces sp. YSPA8]